MTPKTKAFMRELSDLLCKYDMIIDARVFYDDLSPSILFVEDELSPVLVFDECEITWQEIDRMLEDAE